MFSWYITLSINDMVRERERERSYLGDELRVVRERGVGAIVQKETTNVRNIAANNRDKKKD